MKSELVIFLVFVSLAQGTFEPTLSDNFGLSDVHAAILNEIILNQEATINSYYNGIGPLFDTLFDLGPGIDNDASTIAQATVHVKAAIDSYFNASLFVLDGNCAAIQTARNTSHSAIEDTFVRIHTALGLARSGNYSVNRAAIDVHHAAVLVNYENSVQSNYDAIITCLGTTDADILNAIESSRNGSSLSLTQLSNAIFNFIRVHAASVPVACGDHAAKRDVEEFRDQALNRIKSDVEYKYSFIRTLFISSHVNGTGLIPYLAPNQHGLIESFNKYRKAYDTMYALISYYLRRVEHGIRYEGGDHFTRYDGYLAEVNARFSRSGTMTLDAIPLINPDFAAILAVLREELDDMSYEGDMAFLDVLDGVVGYEGTNFTEVQAIMDHYREIAIAVYEPSNVLIFQFIRNNMTWSDEVDSKLIALQAKANAAASDASHRYFDAVEIFARCKFVGTVSQDDWSAIDALLLVSYHEVDVLLQSLFAAGFYVLQANSLIVPAAVTNAAAPLLFAITTNLLLLLSLLFVS